MTTKSKSGVLVIATLAILIAFPALGRAARVTVYPTAVYQPTLDRIVVFVTGNDGHLYDKYWDGSAWVWQDQGIPPGTEFVSFPQSLGAVYQPTLDRIVVFVTAGDGHMWDKYWDGSAWVWEDQGIPPDGVTVDRMRPVYQESLDRIVVFTHGVNLWDKYWDGSAWVWEDQGKPNGARAFADDLSAVYQPTLDRIVVFITDDDVHPYMNHLYDKYWDGSAWVWEDQERPPGAFHISNLSAIYQPTLDRIVVFVDGFDTSFHRHLYDKYWDGSAWVWEDQGLPPGTLSVDLPSAVFQPTLDRMVVFVEGSDGHLWDKYWDGSAWVWEDQGLPPGTRSVATPSAVYQPTFDRIVVFVTGDNGHLYDKYWDGSAWVWEDQGMPQ
jgi:hypothetical protein